MGASALYVLEGADCCETGVPSDTQHPAFLPARKEWRRNEAAGDERDTRMLKKIENKRTCICVQKKNLAPGPRLGAGGAATRYV